MNQKNENELLFDDVAMLESQLGEGCLAATTVNANCDCGS